MAVLDYDDGGGRRKQSVMSEETLAASTMTTDYDSDGSETTLTKKDLERLGRERPAVFASAFGEVSFVFVIVLSLMMGEYFTSGFTILLPGLTKVLDIPSTQRTWPTAAPNLATAALLLPFARLCDQRGSRAVFLAGHAWLLVWSVITGFCQDTITVIVCRAMQGVGFAAFLPAGLALLGHIYRSGPRKNFVYCLYGAFSCVGFYFGILMAAVAADYITWRWWFWIGAGIELVIVAVGFASIPRHLNDVNPLARMDWWGACTLVPGLTLTVFALSDGAHAPSGWKTPYIYLTFIAGGLLLIGTVYTQGWVSAQPLLPKSMFRPKYVKRVVCALFCYYGVFSLFLFYSSLYIEKILKITPMEAAAWYTPLAVGGIVLGLAGGAILHLISGYILMMIAGVGFILSVLLFALIPSSAAASPSSTGHVWWAFIFPAMCCGTIGLGLMFNVTNVFLTNALPKREQAVAGAVINSLMCLGIAFWLGISEVVISTTQLLRSGDVSLPDQYQIGFWLAVALAGVALGLTATVRIGSASADMTADEKEALESSQSEKDEAAP